MVKPTVDDYLQKGIYGQKEIKPDERRKFLGTLRERVIVALKQSQVREKKVYPEVEMLMKQHPKAHLYLNGHMNYADLSKYIHVANRYGIRYTMVTNKEYNSEIGLVLAYDYAIDKEHIYLEQQEEKQTEKKKKPSLLKKIFTKKKFL
ncbi:YueI family protein [Bacillus aquiflavi]|uniref:YueI family protein n=2 Tax=Bacillus aquiflavi TaxID=2672567 RepID=A0A6B3W3Q5_9BACI|nr:YueI family protein [Bacillus aquiflavi]MBA4538254.1 YueI family protein [Bacillus aquiflavi]NEY82573.1 YueI family protein [Bacillus aquiflavi]